MTIAWRNGRTVWASLAALAMTATGAYFGNVTVSPLQAQLASAQADWGDDQHHFIVAAGDDSSGLPSGAAGRADADRLAAKLRSEPGVRSAKSLGAGLVSITTSLSESDVRSIPGVGTTQPDILVQPASLADGNPQELYDHDDEVAPYADDLRAIHAPEAWAHSTGVGAVIAVVDTGVLVDHPDIYANLWHNPGERCDDRIDNDANGYVDDCVGWDAGDNDNNPRPRGVSLKDPSMAFLLREHGTAVAGTAAGRADNDHSGIGVAPKATIMPVKVTSGLTMPFSSIIAGTIYAIDNGADIVTAAYTLPQDAPRSATQVMSAVAEYARARNVLIVAAAGNENLDLDRVEVLPASLSTTFDNVISVGGWMARKYDYAKFTNYGQSVDIVAPGKAFAAIGLFSAYGYVEGTSFSSAYVAGGAALALSRDPSLKPADIKAKLMQTATRMHQLDNLTSTGMLNVSGIVDSNYSQLAASWSGLDSVKADMPFVIRADVELRDADVAKARGAQLRLTAMGTHDYLAYVAEGLRLDVEVHGRTFDVITDISGSAVLDDDLSAVELAQFLESSSIRLAGRVPEGQYGLMLQLTDADGRPLTNGVAQYFQSKGKEAPTPWGSEWPALPITFSDLPPPDPAPESPAPGVAPGMTTSTMVMPKSPGTSPSRSPSPTTTTGSGNDSNSAGDDNTGAPPGENESHGSYESTPSPSAPSTTIRKRSGSGASPTNSSTATSSVTGVSGSSPVDDPSNDGAAGSGSSNNGNAQHVPVDESSSPSTSSSPPTSMVLPEPALPVVENGWTITGVTPTFGSLTGGTVMELTGTFPQYAKARVFLDGQKANVISASTHALTAITPPRVAGTVKVTVVGPEGDPLVVDNAFTYLASQPVPAVPTTTRPRSSSKTSTTVGGDRTNPPVADQPISWEPPREADDPDDWPGQQDVVTRGALTLRKQDPPTTFTRLSMGRTMSTLRCTHGTCPSFSIPK